MEMLIDLNCDEFILLQVVQQKHNQRRGRGVVKERGTKNPNYYHYCFGFLFRFVYPALLYQKKTLGLALTILMTFSMMLLLHDAVHFAAPACHQRHTGILQS